jgi:putative FmdB family regulatory protein
MPIYAYKCSACGHARDVLQKISDVPLTVCPACNAASFQKQVTAAGFQLKGTGWYVTDFRDGGRKNAGENKEKSDTAASDGAADKAADKSADKSADKPADKSADKPAAPGPVAGGA